MHRPSFAAGLLTALLAIPCVLPLAAAPQRTTAPDTEEAATSEEPKYTGRLPNYYGKAGVSDEQRMEIYKIQTEYAAQIDPLLSEIEDLRADRDAEVADVLTDEQQADVRRMRAEARERRRSRS